MNIKVFSNAKNELLYGPIIRTGEHMDQVIHDPAVLTLRRRMPHICDLLDCFSFSHFLATSYRF